MAIYIDNTNVVRVTNVTTTDLAGVQTPVTGPGEYTLYDGNGDEVVGQTWPAVLTLVNDGNYAGYLQADLALSATGDYKLEIKIGDGGSGLYQAVVDINPKVRTD